MVNAGATWLDQPIVRDRNLVTSRGPQDLVPFLRAIVQHFSGERVAASNPPRADTSAPQRAEPPRAVLSAMKWTPRPSLRTLAGVALVAAAAAAFSGRRAA
jgi:protease I